MSLEILAVIDIQLFQKRFNIIFLGKAVLLFNAFHINNSQLRMPCILNYCGFQKGIKPFDLVLY